MRCETCGAKLHETDNIVGRWCDDVCADGGPRERRRLDEEAAEEATKRAHVVLRQGRQHLVVRGLVVATEGDLCRSPDLPRKWTPEMLRRVRDLINDAAEVTP